MTIENDLRRFKSVLIHFIGNALKFTSKGQIQIIISDAAQFENCISIKIKDTGSGMNEEEIKSL